MQKGGVKEPTAKEMIEDLEANVRRTVATKQKEYDRLVFSLKQAKAEAEKLRLDLKDVQLDKEALGIKDDTKEDPGRLQVVKTVFTKPFHIKDAVSGGRHAPAGLMTGW